MSVYSYGNNNSSSVFNGLTLKNLIDKAKLGEEPAYTEIYNTYFEKLYRFIYYRVSHRETAEDLTEEVFIKAFNNLHTLQNHQVFEGWLYQIARNQVIDHYRSKKQVVPLEDVEHILEDDFNIVDDLNATHDQQLIIKALTQLPPDYQQILRLKFFDELSTSAIAEVLQKNEGTVRVLQHRAVARLKLVIDSFLDSNNQL